LNHGGRLKPFGIGIMVDPQRKIWDSELNLTIPDVDYKAFPIAQPLRPDEMEWVSRRWTVCQILREVYHAIDDERLKFKLLVASRMTKEMVITICKKEPHWGKYRWPWRDKKFETEGSK